VSEPDGARRAGRLTSVALLFLQLGVTAFGGPAAHIAMMEDEVVTRRRWLSREDFLDLLGATNLIPGPNSTEMAIHVGHRRAGWLGLLIAGSCFILPAAAITLALAWAYVRFGTLPGAAGLLYGVKPAVVAVVAQALWKLGRSAVKSIPLAVIAAASIVASALGTNELVVLGAAGLCVIAWLAIRRKASLPALAMAPLPLFPAAAAAPATVGLLQLFLVFLKIGAVLFGSGYVLLAFLRAELVVHRHWLTETQLLDAIAIGQVTPGPVFTTATFVGYLVARFAGAGVATAGIFLPAFVFVALSGPLVPRLRRSQWAGAFLDGVNVASLALMAVVTWHLARAALVDPISILLAAASAVLLVRFRVNSAWLILGGAVLGLVLQWQN
jgi:chromate transporter